MSLPECKYGPACYRKNPQHFLEYSHPWNDDNKKREADDAIENPGAVKQVKPAEPLELVASNQDVGVFPNPFDVGDYGSGSTPYTLVELHMMAAAGAIKDKPLWHVKVRDDTIRRKWEDEIIGHGLHPTQAKYIVDELHYWGKKASQQKGIFFCPSPVDGVWQSDSLVEEALRQELSHLVEPLERAVPVDYHPGTNEQVIDLVHPSLYPYVQGLTRETTFEYSFNGPVPWDQFIGGGSITSRVLLNAGAVQKPQFNFYGNAAYRDTSAKYQWLPTDVQVDDDGHCHFLSYINNLHPQQHRPLYTVLETILEAFLPMFGRVLTDLRNPIPRRHDVDLSEDALYGKFDKSYQDEDYDEKYDEWRENRTPKVPQEVLPFEPPKQDWTIDWKGRRLQVIVKLANIVLTPEKPSYPGGSWHVEGMRNENIVASGIYYWHSENISESKLAFRTDVCEPNYEQGDNEGVAAVYGLYNDSPLVQTLGAVTTMQGRAIAFPNVLQHQVQPFQLVDKTKPGYRKILVFFLVEPSTRIISTSIVPPQQLTWMQMAMKQQKPIPGLPSDLQAKIAGDSDWFFPHDLALQHRLELMEERKYFINANTTQRFEREFSLCEH